jgi:hypothetical protein
MRNGSGETKSMVLNLYEGSRNKSTRLVVVISHERVQSANKSTARTKNNSELGDYHADQCVCNHSWRGNNTIRPENSPAEKLLKGITRYGLCNL